MRFLAGYAMGPWGTAFGGALPEQPSTSQQLIIAGRYRVESRVGIGGQAAVYKVFDQRLQVHRAIKVLMAEFSRRGPMRERFQAEAHAMANLDHPNIVRVFDVVPDAELPFIVMEFLPGGSLAQWIEKHGPMPARLAVRCALEIAAAAGAAHRAGVIHRDIKPHNVLVDADGSCKLGDFGIARAGGAVLRTLIGARMGTEGYMAPEQSRDASRADERADLFGMGATLWVMLGARDPVELFRDGLFEGVPEPLQRVIKRATATKPEDRYANARAFASDLDAAATLLGGDRPAPPLVQPTPSEVDDFREIHLIAEPMPMPAPKAPASVAADAATPDFGYLMPSYEADEPDLDPDWLVEEPAEEQVGHYAVTAATAPSDPQRTASPAPAPERPPVEVDMLHSLWETVGIQLPLLALPGILGAIGIVVFAHITMGELSAAVEDASDTYERVLHEDFMVVDGLAHLGADSFELQSQWDSVVYAKTDIDREQEARSFVALVRAQAERVAAPGSEMWEAVEDGVHRMVVAQDELSRAQEAYLQREPFLGPFAFGVHRPPIPPPGAPTRRLRTGGSRQ